MRLISRPDARTVAIFRADARRAINAPSGAQGSSGKLPGRPLGTRTIAATLGILFLAGIATAVLGSRGVRDVVRSQEELRELEARVVARQESVTALLREVRRLKEDRLATERIARESLGYVRPGEITFLLPAEGGATRGVGATRSGAGAGAARRY